MKVIYRPEDDVLRILFCNAPIQESETHPAGLILDFDQQGRIIGLELARASALMSRPEAAGLFEYAIARNEPTEVEESKVL